MCGRYQACSAIRRQGYSRPSVRGCRLFRGCLTWLKPTQSFHRFLSRSVSSGVNGRLSRATLLLAGLCLGPYLSGYASSLPPDNPVAVLTSGRTIPAQLKGVHEKGAWTFDQAGQTVVVPRDQLVFWGAFRDRYDRSWVVLHDGSVLVAELLRIEAEAVVMAGRLWPETRLPRSEVRAIVLRPPFNSLKRDRLMFRVLSGERKKDLLLLEHGDELRGRVPDVVKPEPGAFHPETINWPVQDAVEPVKLSLRKVTAILFAADQAESSNRPAAQWVGLRDGSRLVAVQVEQARDSLRFELAGGIEITTDVVGISGSNPFEAVSCLQPMGAHVKYLSNIKPVGYKHIPFLSTRWPYQEDRSVGGGRLRSEGTLWLKGLGMHSSSRVAYEVPEPYGALHAELCVDERAGGHGSVVFRVYLQNSQGNWRKAHESDVVRGGQSPVPMRVELDNAVRVALIVDFADRADQWDHANWLNARFVVPESP